MGIKIIIDEYHSKPDIYGNTYYGTVITSTKHGSETFRYSDNTNNAKHYARETGLEWDEIHHIESQLPIRQFNSYTKDWPYMKPEEIQDKIKEII